MDDSSVFKHKQYRLATSFDEATIEYDKSFRLTLEHDVAVPVYVRKNLHGKPVRFQPKRKIIICVLRTAYTGTPYTGIAILHPDEKYKAADGAADARILALRRAISAFCQDHNEDPKDVYHSYREERFKRDHPGRYEAAQRAIAQNMEAAQKPLEDQRIDKFTSERFKQLLESLKVGPVRD